MAEGGERPIDEVHNVIKEAADKLLKAIGVSTTPVQPVPVAQANFASHADAADSDEDFLPEVGMFQLPSRFGPVRPSTRRNRGGRRHQCAPSSSVGLAAPGTSGRGIRPGRPLPRKRCFIKQVVCLPADFADNPNGITIPRRKGREELDNQGCIQTLSFTNNDSFEDIQKLISRLFGPKYGLKHDEILDFTILSCVRGMKKLQVSTHSSSFEWTYDALLKAAGQGSIYILPNKRHQPVTNVPALPDPVRGDSVDSVEDSAVAHRICPPHLLDTLGGNEGLQVLPLEEEIYEPEPDVDITEAEIVENRALEGVEPNALLQSLMSCVVDNNRQQCIMLRQRCAVQDFKSWLRKPGITLKNPVFVKFIGQTGVDDKGLTRQLATYIIKWLSESPLFVGDPGRLTLSNNILFQQEYRIAGQMVAFVLCHAGLVCPLFSKSLVRHICCDSAPADIEDIPHEEMVSKISKIQTEDVFPSEMALQLAEEIRFGPTALGPRNRAAFLEMAKAYYITIQNRAQIDWFEAGLDDLGILPILKKHPDAAVGLLTSAAAPVLDSVSLFSLLTTDFSDSGSNNRQFEEEIVLEFSHFLHDCSTGVAACSLADVLQFISGARCIPPCGFQSFNSVPTIDFRDTGYPSASTCTLTLTLPRKLPPGKQLADIMIEAIKGSPMFDD